MLTESQYRELLRYRYEDVQDDGASNEVIKFLCRKKYIVKYHPLKPDGNCYETVMRSITQLGQDALEKFEYSANKVHQESAEKKAEKKSDRRFQLLDTLFGAVIGSLLTLLAEHHDCVINFFLNLFS